MAQPLRIWREEEVYLVTNRCFQSRHFFRPDAEVNRILLGCLGRALHERSVKLVSFTFMPGRFAMVLWAPHKDVSLFMQSFQSMIARRLNRYGRRDGSIFHGRFASSASIDQITSLERVYETLMAPVEADLVARPADWEGVSSWPIHATGEPLVGRWLDYGLLRPLERKHRMAPTQRLRARAMHEYPIDVHLPPGFEEMADFREMLCAEIGRRVAQARARRKNHRLFLRGMPRVRSTPWGWKPPGRTRRQRPPICRAASPELERRYMKRYQTIRRAYQRTMKRWRRGEAVRFPACTIPPGWTQCLWHRDEVGAKGAPAHLIGV